MLGLYTEIIPPSGVEHAIFLNLTSLPSPKKFLGNLVVARSSYLRIYDVCEEPAPLPSLEQVENDTRGDLVRRGTEAVEGEVAMDEKGEGFVNMATVKNLPPGMHVAPPTVTKLFLVREHRLHGIVTGLGRAQTTSTSEDGLDRLLISFLDAKISLMEWSLYNHDLSTVSLHTYERAPQLLNLPPPSSASPTPYTNIKRPKLRVDPLSRCLILTLPQDSVAILPFQSQAELDMMDDLDKEMGRGADAIPSARDVPYQPSFILDLPADVDSKVRNIVDVIFMHGFNNPTIAVAFQERQTWTGRLNEFKDTTSIYIIALDLVTRSYPIIAQIDSLPYDVLYLVPCPAEASYGGVLAVTANAVIQVDQAGKTVGVAVNGWTNRVSSLNFPLATDSLDAPLDLILEGSQVYFANESTLVLFLADGDIRLIRLIQEGRAIAKFEVGPVIAKSTLPSSIVPVGDGFLFVASVTGDSVLLKKDFVEVIVEKVNEQTTGQDDADMELDEDIYGDLKANDPDQASGPQVETIQVLKLSLADAIPDHGTISAMCFVLTKPSSLDPVSPELVACTGAGDLAGFTRFTKTIPTRTKRALPTIGGSHGIWSFPVKRSHQSSTGRTPRARDPSEGDWVMITTNDGQGQGITRFVLRSSRASNTSRQSGPGAENRDIRISSKPGVTVCSGPFFQTTAATTVGRDGSVRLFDGDLAERQVILGTSPSRVRTAYVSDPYVLLVREDDTVELYIGDMMEGKIKREESHQLPKCAFASIFNDQTGLFQNCIKARKGENQPETERLEDVLDTERGSQWLMLHTTSGNTEIRSLPSAAMVFIAKDINSLPTVLTSHVAGGPGDLDDEAEANGGSSSVELETLLLVSLGETHPRPYLLLLTKRRLLALYEIIPSQPLPDQHLPFKSSLCIQLVKVYTRTLELPPSSLGSVFVPFSVAHGSKGTPISGVFCTGWKPFWIVATDKAGPRVYPSRWATASAFTSCGDMFSDVATPVRGIGGRQDDFVIHSEEGPCLIQWMGDVELGPELPVRRIPASRHYTAILFDPPTGHVVAISSQKATFRLFDEEGNPTWAPDGPGISYPHCECSSVELISPDTWTAVDGYEFAQNEFVNAAESVSLETPSTEKGVKDFVVVGTTISRGEDLAVKGAVYIFEVIEVVPDPESPKRKHKLRLLCRDEAKGPVTAVCGINGYLVSSMGQKVFVRAFEMDERLVGVAFLDVGLYVTSLRTLKNLLLIGDAVKSIWFVCFQEDPFKLITLAKDQQAICVSNANFFFGEGKNLSFITTDEDGIIRMYEYNPMDPDSNNGQHLLCRTEFNTYAEMPAALTIARRPEPILPDSTEEIESQIDPGQAQSVLLFGSLEGAISILVPVSQDVYRRLSLLQGQLIRNVQHTAGLNPKSHRVVHNDKVSRPLSKGILDGELLSAFAGVEVGRQNEMTRQIGTDRMTVLKDGEWLWKLW